MLGSALGHYRIVGLLGTGGMGEVYRAADTRLGREVALKVLPAELTGDAERLARFEREARTLAALNHRNIVTIHSVEEAEGIRFLTMELVEGRTLAAAIPRGGMALERCLAIGTALADALAAAHGRGVVHRDLKPGNVMLTSDGQVKVLDFGLAKLEAPAADVEVSELPTRSLVEATQEGRLLGTAPYMSPEQLQGRPVDSRSDLFSLGAILHELATGLRPFRGATPVETLTAILRDTPPGVTELRPELPPQLGRIVRHCLEKDPEKRFQTAKDVRNELQSLREERLGAVTTAPTAFRRRRWRWPAAAALAVVALAAGVLLWSRSTDPPRSALAATDLPRLAVLPFEDLGPPEDAYFAAGLTEEIVSRLAAVQGLQVLSRTTMVGYDRAGKTVQEIGHDLGLDYLLEGTVRWDRVDGLDRLRITPQLIRVADDTHLWADRYDRDLADVFAVQSDIASHVVRALGVTLSEREKHLVEMQPTANLEAYQLYLRGLKTFADGQVGLVEGGERNLALTADLMRRATELDPDFALAHARLASTLAFRYFLGGPAEQLVEARAALERAQALDPGHPEVRMATGYLHYWGGRDYGRALAEFEAASAEMPSNADAHSGAGAVLRRLGRYEDAITRFERARALAGPEGGTAVWNPGRDIVECLVALRRYAEADRILEGSLQATPDRAQLWAQRAFLWAHWRGATDGAWALLAEAPEGVQRELLWVRVYLHLADRDFSAAVGAVSGEPLVGPLSDRWIDVAYALRRLGRDGEATDLARRIVIFHQPALAANPDAAFVHRELGMAHALLGERQPALEHARRAVELLASDAFWGPGAIENLAIIHVLLGDRDEAVRLVTELLAKDYQWPLNPQRLQLEPWWDPLREDPRFRALLAESEAEAG